MYIIFKKYISPDKWEKSVQTISYPDKTPIYPLQHTATESVVQFLMKLMLKNIF